MSDGWQIAESIATGVGAVGAVVLGYATYQVSRHLHKIEQARSKREEEASKRDEEAHVLALARARPRLDIYDGVAEHAERWAVQVRNPSDAPDLLDVRGVIVLPDGTKREMQSERGRALVAGDEAVFTFPADSSWFVRSGGTHELAPGIRITFSAQDGTVLAERIGG